MSKDEVLLRIAAIVATLGEVNEAPESQLYMFCDMSLEYWYRLRHIMVESDLIRVKNNLVTLTPNGRNTADRMNSSLRLLEN